jgi:uncharacterized protein (TIGR00255 family)
MIKSMTGFGQAVTETSRFTCKVEIKSLNNKFLELTMRLPRQWQHKETDIRKQLTKKLERGTVVVSINYQYKQVSDLAQPINKELAAYYLNQLQELAIANNLKLKSLFKSVFEFPNIVSATEEQASEEEWQVLLNTLQQAFDVYDAYRKHEGMVLQEELTMLCNRIETKMFDLAVFEPKRIASIKSKLQKELDNLKVDIVDKNRFEQELIYYLEKMDINEEQSRLKQHCKYFIETLSQPASGKKLSFIAQEMGREINTIGSKSYDAAMQRLVVEMKDDLEKIKEQVNNIL